MKEIRLNAFEMNCVGHQSPGLWAHPRDHSASYTDLDYWTGLAKTLERGKFDGIFLADVLGVYDVYGGSPDAALRHAVQVPVNDPVLLIPAMAQVTEHLGFGVTSTLPYEPPYPFARRMSTLDHLTKGRAGWNIVTGYLDSAARGVGGAGPVVVGTPEMVADKIETWFEATDVDGLNVAFAISPGDFEDIADMLVPELTRRGRYKAEYAQGTLREKLFGEGRARLGAPHPAAGFRVGRKG